LEFGIPLGIIFKVCDRIGIRIGFLDIVVVGNVSETIVEK
jgi:hypothetical protein